MASFFLFSGQPISLCWFSGNILAIFTRIRRYARTICRLFWLERQCRFRADSRAFVSKGQQ
ncbi:MAG: hypothetical protein LBS40_02595 [Burkholderiales bacterium]|nr:hypothetical protein [Burkholderiales bacterium]